MVFPSITSSRPSVRTLKTTNITKTINQTKRIATTTNTSFLTLFFIFLSSLSYFYPSNLNPPSLTTLHKSYPSFCAAWSYKQHTHRKQTGSSPTVLMLLKTILLPRITFSYTISNFCPKSTESHHLSLNLSSSKDTQNEGDHDFERE